MGDELPDLGEFLHMERTIGSNLVAHIRRHDWFGVPGYDIVCLNSRAEGIWRALVANDATPAGNALFETLRIEAGKAIYGIDIDENRFVMEVPQPLRGVSYAKGCYLGQEPIVMARDRAGHVNRTLLGVKILSHELPASGAKVFHGAEEIGTTTSVTRSPALGCGIALAYIRRGHQDPGTPIEIESPTTRLNAEILGWPPIPRVT
jgi:folate-binding protein YgfZ